ncbi:SH3 domain-containing protein [Ruminococcus albus]|uniref:SH3 domain-containing protein n=1 Tax=Ruminococcus albus TaxID=1264 RepID=A0A1I1IPF3_RUMAL|nr:SH3 domain-containing protein [Ruminococcus albus]SFC36158.1 SH3 domain-containing protein [Ruminococcus albus]
MPENNQHRNNYSRQPMQGQGGQYRQSQHNNMQGRPDRQGARRPSPNRQGARRSRKQQENDAQISAAVKGIIAIMLTLLIVVVVIMLFWKSLFTGAEKGPVATGTITSTEYHAPETKTATEREDNKKSTKKKTSKKRDEDEDDEDTQKITCTGAVLLHPEPSSSSATLDTIPQGVEVTFIRNENNWFYVEYNGQEGYAWGNYFTAPVGLN